MTQALRGVVDEVILAFVPLVAAAQDPGALEALLRDLGWTPASVPKPLSDLAVAGAKLIDAIGSDEDSVSLAQEIDAIARLLDAVDRIRSQPDAAFPSGIDVASFKTTIGRDLLDYLLVNHLLQNHHRVGGMLRLTGLIRLVDTPASGLRQRYLRRQVAWDKIGPLLTDPAKGFRDAFGWDSGAPALTEAIGVLGSLLESYGLQFSYLKLDGNLGTFTAAGATAASDAGMGIDLAFDPDLGAPKKLSAGVQLVVRPATAARDAAISLLPYADLAGAKEIAISESMKLTIKGDADFSKGVALTLAPGRPIDLQSGFFGGAAVTPAEIQVGLEVTALPGEPERILIGTGDGSRLAMRSVSLSAGAKLISPGKLDAFVELAFKAAHVVIKPAPGDGDSFLASLLGDQGVSAELSPTLRLSSLSGFHLKGSADLRTRFPLGVRAGPVDVRDISIALNPGSDAVALVIGASVSRPHRTGARRRR